MRSVEVAGLHHLAIKSETPRALADFYIRVLGMKEASEHRDDNGIRSVWLALGRDQILMIERTDGLTPSPRDFAEDPPGFHLLAFRMPAAERSAWRARLAAEGVSVAHSTQYTLYFQDLDGNRIGLSSWPESGTE